MTTRKKKEMQKMQTAMKQPDLFGQTTVMKAANDNVRDSVH